MFQEKRWCCQTGLNCRPLHYQWSALPLSYGSVPPIKGIGQKGPYKAADPCHKAPSRASVRSSLRRHQKGPQLARGARGLFQPAQLRADPVSHFLTQRLQRLDGADHDLEFDHFAGVIEFNEIDAL